MKQTSHRNADHMIAADIETLAAMLGCGRDTARKIGRESGAEIRVNRRVLFNIRKVQAYIDSMSS